MPLHGLYEVFKLSIAGSLACCTAKTYGGSLLSKMRVTETFFDLYVCQKLQNILV